MFDTSCLGTTIKNVSGAPLRCSFLPPHGLVLDEDEEVTLAGDLLHAITRGRYAAQRQIRGLISALEQGLLQIVSSQATILQDKDTDESQMLVLDGGTLDVEEPCFANSVSEE